MTAIHPTSLRFGKLYIDKPELAAKTWQNWAGKVKQLSGQQEYEELFQGFEPLGIEASISPVVGDDKKYNLNFLINNEVRSTLPSPLTCHNPKEDIGLIWDTLFAFYTSYCTNYIKQLTQK